MNTSDTQNTDTPARPFGYWIKAVDRLMAAEFASAFEGEHASRRDWRLLSVVDGTAPVRRPLNAHKLHGLVERGWVVADGDDWTLTDEGRAAKDRLGATVDGIRAKVTDAVSPDDLATTLASLQQITRAFGWDEETPLPRGRGRRHAFGRRGFGPHAFGHRGFEPRDFGRRGFEPRDFGPGDFGPGDFEPHGYGRGGFDGRHGRPFGRERGFGPSFAGSHRCDTATHTHDCAHRGHADHESTGTSEDRGDAHPHEHDGHTNDHGHPHRPRHGGHRIARATQHSYERGFDAGFARGRDA